MRLKKIFLFSVVVFLSFAVVGQNKDKQKEKKTIKEVIEELPEMLIAQPDAGPDTNANKLINDNLSIVINPMWREMGTHTIIDFKLQKISSEPLSNTFPLKEQELVQALSINMNTIKKTAEEKKQAVLALVKNHISAYYKEAGISISPQELSDKTNATVTSSETFTTDEGKQGTIYYINDIEASKSHFIVLLLIPSSIANYTCFVQFTYTRYTYETSLPEDIFEQRTFQYPDYQQEYMDFTRKILRTFRIK